MRLQARNERLLLDCRGWEQLARHLLLVLLQVIQIGRVQRDFFDHFPTDDLRGSACILARCCGLHHVARSLRLTDELLGLGVDFLDAVRALDDPVHFVLRRTEQISHPREVFLRIVDFLAGRWKLHNRREVKLSRRLLRLLLWLHWLERWRGL